MSSYEAQRDDLLLYNAPQYRLRTNTPHPCVAIQIYETSARLIKQLTMSCNSIAAIESNQDANVFNASRGRGGGRCVGRGKKISAAHHSPMAP